MHQKQLRQKWNNIGKDVVVLHQFSRGKFCPNLGPFALKLETFLRLAKINYVVDTEEPFGPKHKCPWITFNGEDFSDSEAITTLLTDYFKVSIDNSLSKTDKAISEACRIVVEDHLFWCVIAWRYWLDSCNSFMKSQKFSPFMTIAFPLFMPKTIKSISEVHGIGRNSAHQIYNLCEKDCAILADVLGEKKYFGGDIPCIADCAIFGGLSQLLWNAPGSIYEAIITDLHPNLEKYCLRMKEIAFPDWNNLLEQD